MHTNLIILAGGASSRMKKEAAVGTKLSQREVEEANQRSKALISIDPSGRPLLDYLLYNAKQAGYKHIYLVTGEENTMFKARYGKEMHGNDFHGLIVHYAIQRIPSGRKKPLGTADALFQALVQYPELQNHSFTVCNSDNLYSIEALRLLKTSKMAPNALIGYDREALLFDEDRIAKFALVVLDRDHYLLDIIEKPSRQDIQELRKASKTLYVSMNVFRFDGTMFFNYLKHCPLHPIRNEKELPTALLNMIKDHPRSTFTLPLSEHVPDLTSKHDIAIMKTYIQNMDLSAWS